ncbi:MAG TPA: hypothetical protein VKS24_00525 [Bradyrhizobium sp.]|nr:hypothetical protein [Bradyrhizobium sp.]
MNAFTTGDRINQIIWVLVFVGFVYSTNLAGRIAERRGRGFWGWVSIAGICIGPLAIPLLFLLPNLRREDPTVPKARNALMM